MRGSLPSDTASSTSRATDSRERSEVEAAATEWPTNTRRARCCSRACFTVSTWPSLTCAENDWSSTTKASADVAPRRPACSSISVSRSIICRWALIIALDLGAADGHPVDPYGRQPHAHRDRLTVLAARAHALVEPQVVADPRDPREGFGPVADQGRSLHRHRDTAV